MHDAPLRIKWPYQAIDVDDPTSNAIIIRNPLTACSITLGYASLYEDRKRRYELRNLQDFCFMLQDITENEYNVQLSKIYEQTLQSQEASALQMQYLQLHMMHMSFHIIGLNVVLDNGVKTRVISIVKDSIEPMDWEWTSPAPMEVKNLVTDFDTESQEGVLTLKAIKRDADEKE